MRDGLRFTDVTCDDDGVRVLDRVTLVAPPGRLTAVVGPPGAGTSAVLRVAAGVLTPAAGSVTLDGTPVTPAARRRWGYVPQQGGLHPRMSVHDQLVHLGQLHGLTTRDARRATDDLLDVLGLGESAGSRLQALPFAEQRRARLAAALVHRPTCVLLDHPFDGLAPAVVGELVALVRERVAEGGAPVVVATRPDLAERWCDDVVVLEGGRVVGDAAVGRGRHLRLVAEVDEDAVPGLVDALAGVSGVVVLEREERAGGASRLVTVVLGLTEDADDQVLLAVALRHGRVRELAEPGALGTGVVR